MRTLYLEVLEHTPQISCQLYNLAFWSTFSVNFLFKKIYINLNNIDMLLLRTSYRCGVFLE